MGVVILGKWLYLPVPLGPSLPLATWAWTLVFACYHSVRKTPSFFSELVKIITSLLISKCHITFLLGHSVKGYPCFASHSYPQKYGRKKIMSLKNFVSMSDHFNFILLADVVFFFLCRFIQSQRSMTRMLIAVPRPSLMLIPVTGPLSESLCR